MVGHGSARLGRDGQGTRLGADRLAQAKPGVAGLGMARNTGDISHKEATDG